MLLMSFLTWPFSVFADSPPNVTGLSARFENGQIFVRWDGLEDIDAYRVYYGQKSILDNYGAYDDFVTTNGKNTELILADLPPYQQIFIAVLATNADGEESLSFTEEVQLDLTGDAIDGQKTEKESPSPSRRERELTTVGLLNAIATSSNTVQLTFSANVQVPADRATEAFTLIDNQGNPLRLSRIVIEGNIVTLTTENQIPGRNYAVRVNDPVTSNPLAGPQLPIDSARNVAEFTAANTRSTINVAEWNMDDNKSADAAITESREMDASTRANLVNSGAPVLGTMIVSGAIVGWRRMRRRMTAK